MKPYIWKRTQNIKSMVFIFLCFLCWQFMPYLLSVNLLIAQSQDSILTNITQLGNGSIQAITWDSGPLTMGTSDSIWIYSDDLQLAAKLAMPDKDHLYVEDMKWSPNGQLLAVIVTSSAINQSETFIQVWQRNSWELLTTIHKMYGGTDLTLAWNPTNRQLAIKDNLVIEIWDVEAPSLLTTLEGHSSEITSIDWNPIDLDILVSSSLDSTVKIWNTSSGQIIESFNLSIFSPEVVWSADGTQFAVTNLNDIQVRDRFGGQVIQTLVDSSDIRTFFWKSTFLISVNSDNIVRNWNLTTAQINWEITINSADRVSDLAFDSTLNRFLVLQQSDFVSLWSAQDGLLNAKLADYNLGLRIASWRHDSQEIATVDLSNRIQVWDVNTKAVLQILDNPLSSINSIMWSSTSDKIGGGLADGRIVVWDSSTGQLVKSVQGHDALTVIAWRPNNNEIASAGNDASVKLWDSTNLQIIDELIGHTARVLSLAWSADGTMLASADENGGIIIWNVSSGEPVELIDASSSPVNSIAWSPNSNRIAFSNIVEGIITIWDIETKTILFTANVPHIASVPIVWHPNKEQVATVSDASQMQIWEVGEDWLVTEFKASNELVTSIGWSSNGSQLFTAGYDGIVRIWLQCLDDTSLLVSEIILSNSSGTPTILCLARDNLYTITTPDNGLNALPIITGDITIEGNGATLTRDDTANMFRFFEVAPGGSLTLNNLTLSNGEVDDAGGAILNHGTLIINDSTLHDNYAHHSGGAIYNTGSLTVTNTTFNANTTAANGAGGALATTGDANLTATTITHNSARYGGGISNSGSLSLVDTVVNHNQASFEGNGAFNGGGGLINQGSNGTVTISGGEFRGNVAYGRGGGIYNAYSTNTLTIEGSVIADNTAVRVLDLPRSVPAGGGIASYGTLSITDTHIVDNTVALSAGGAIYASHQATVQQSCITGNSSTSVYLASGTFDLTNNWWGATDGPSGSGSGSGDSINLTSGYQPFIATGCPLP